ncbi:hypothetical protein [Ruegeria sp. HKCCD8929]|uniref:hypothetical protein n=1 Tax=Ruegeria sp. HKCCD8929 TaxID=2683006 RepID=UPI0020C32920|nr:hypothetical protein [Ruegeria sp. HKCCD8929]
MLEKNFLSAIVPQHINGSLAEFYGDTLPDSPEAAATPRPGTAVAKDLAYYPTPEAVIDQVLARLSLDGTPLVLEPSCGCGRIMQVIRKTNPEARITGVEYHGGAPRRRAPKGFGSITRTFWIRPPTRSLIM